MKEHNSKIDYRSVMNLGFVREEGSDPIFFEKNGYDWFLVRKKIDKKIIAEWDCETKLVRIIRINNSQNILAEMPIQNLEHLKNIIMFFSKKKKEVSNG
jgi:hypothetical protein